MGVEFRNNPKLHDHLLRQQKVMVAGNIGLNATPANKIVSSDLPGAMYIRTQGLTAAADAVEDVSGLVAAAPSDANGIFAILLDDQCEKIMEVRVVSGLGTVGSLASEITPGGRILVDIDCDVNFSTTAAPFVLELTYLKK